MLSSSTCLAYELHCQAEYYASEEPSLDRPVVSSDVTNRRPGPTLPNATSDKRNLLPGSRFQATAISRSRRGNRTQFFAGIFSGGGCYAQEFETNTEKQALWLGSRTGPTSQAPPHSLRKRQ